MVAKSIERPLPGHQILRRWVIQCKRWRKSPSKKRLHDGFAAAIEHHPDYYLLLGTFTITSALADWVESVRPDYPFRILVVGRDEIERWFECSPDIAHDLHADRGAPAPYTTLMTTLISDLGPEVTAGPELLTTLSLAMSLCCAHGHYMVNSIHLLMALNARENTTAGAILETCGLPVRRLHRVFGFVERSMTEETALSASRRARTVMKKAARIAVSARGSNQAEGIDLLAGLLMQPDCGAVAVLKALGVDLDVLIKRISAAQEPSASVLDTPDYLYSQVLSRLSDTDWRDSGEVTLGRS
jgi:hypothetical protein